MMKKKCFFEPHLEDRCVLSEAKTRNGNVSYRLNRIVNENLEELTHLTADAVRYNYIHIFI